MEMRELVSYSVATLATIIYTASAQSAVIINEIDYDQPGTDTAEFIELFNSNTQTVALDGYSVALINGTSGSAYSSYALDGYSIGSAGYFVLCNDGQLSVSCQFNVASTASSGWIQNGGSQGDAIALYFNNQLIDSVAYEAINTALAPFAEGGGHAGEDASGDIMSLSRIADGTDTNFNSHDFSTGCITPGSANISGSGDCTTVSAVPVPAAAWLFISGLAGMVHTARRQRR